MGAVAILLTIVPVLALACGGMVQGDPLAGASGDTAGRCDHVVGYGAFTFEEPH